MSPRALLIAALPFALLGACTGSPPTFTVAEAYVAGKTDAGTLVNIAIDAKNTSGDPIPLWQLNYTVDMPGHSAKGTVSRFAEATVAAGSTVRFEIPVTTNAAGNVPLNLHATVAYVPGGRFRELLTEVGIPLPTTSFNGGTTVNLDESPRAAAGTPFRIATAKLVDSPPRKPADTLPPLPAR